jgi:hypothetical protein
MLTLVENLAPDAASEACNLLDFSQLTLAKLKVVELTKLGCEGTYHAWSTRCH